MKHQEYTIISIKEKDLIKLLEKEFDRPIFNLSYNLANEEFTLHV